MNVSLNDLAECCGDLSTVELGAVAEQIDQAQAMLSQSLGQLRECFQEWAALAPPGSTHPMSPRFEDAMIALQAEDTVDQLLEHTRLRLSKLARLIKLHSLLTADLARAFSEQCPSPSGLETFIARFEHQAQGLIDLNQLRQPVKNGQNSSDSIQFF